MAHFFRQPDRRQRFLLPVDMMDWLPEGDIVHVILDAVGLMDLSDFEATCKVGRAGQPPFAPAMLLAATKAGGSRTVADTPGAAVLRDRSNDLVRLAPPVRRRKLNTANLTNTAHP